LHLRRRVRDGGNSLIGDLQALPSAGALPMVASGIAVQRLRELPAVVDQHCAETNHPFVKVRQQLQEIRPLLTVPQNAGLVVIEPMVLRQSGRVSRPQLAECGVHEAPPGGGPLPDQIQVIRAEEYGVVYLTQGGAVFGRHLIHPHLPPPVPVQLHPGAELPVSGGDPGFQHSGGRIEGNHLPVRPGPGGFPAGE
ncbi:DUF1836 domain-containing protein, partial [Dysosmobacter welbionis]